MLVTCSISMCDSAWGLPVTFHLPPLPTWEWVNLNVVSHRQARAHTLHSHYSAGICNLALWSEWKLLLCQHQVPKSCYYFKLEAVAHKWQCFGQAPLQVCDRCFETVVIWPPPATFIWPSFVLSYSKPLKTNWYTAISFQSLIVKRYTGQIRHYCYKYIIGKITDIHCFSTPSLFEWIHQWESAELWMTSIQITRVT